MVQRNSDKISNLLIFRGNHGRSSRNRRRANFRTASSRAGTQPHRLNSHLEFPGAFHVLVHKFAVYPPGGNELQIRFYLHYRFDFGKLPRNRGDSTLARKNRQGFDFNFFHGHGGGCKFSVYSPACVFRDEKRNRARCGYLEF